MIRGKFTDKTAPAAVCGRGGLSIVLICGFLSLLPGGSG